MNPDPKESLPREILEELMEEGAEAFRSVLEKLLNLAMGAVKLTDLRTYSASWPFPKLLILRSSADGFRLQKALVHESAKAGTLASAEGTVKLTDLAPNQRLGHSLSC